MYATILAVGPRSFREAHGTEALADLEELLHEAERFAGRSVVGTALRAIGDLLGRLLVEWWAEWRPSRDGLETRAGSRRQGMGERSMNAVRELRLAARALSKRPGFAAVAVLTLALGIGANVAIFSIVNAVLLRPLPYEDSDHLVEYRHHAPGLDLQELFNSEGMIAFYDENADFYELTGVYGRGSGNLTGGDEAARVQLAMFSPEVLQVLRVQPMIGRPFNEEDAGPDRPDAAILSYDTWNARFGSDRGILGRTIEIDGETVEVVGVMPEGFGFPDADVDVYRSMFVDPDGQFGAFGLRTISRLSPGITAQIAQARSNELIASRLTDAFPSLAGGFLESAAFSASVQTRRDRVVADVESRLWIVVGTVAFVLLIACANVANLFLVRAESRQKEMAIRGAMGAGRRTVAVSFLSEALLLGVAGGAVGVLFATGAVRWLLTIADLPRSAEVSIDVASLGLAALLSIASALAFGAIPLARYAGTRFAAILRDGGRAQIGGRQRQRARNILVTAQLALGMILLVGSGLMLRSFVELRGVDLGLEPEGVLTLALNRNRGEDPEVAARYFQEAADRVASLPGVAMVGITNNLPLATGGSNGGSFYIESRPRQEDELPPVALYRAVGPSYFESLGIPVLAGRPVERADWEEPRSVVWVNESFARTFFGGDAIGERIAWENGGREEAGEDTPWAEIVGVVADAREFGLKDEDMRPGAYFPLRAVAANVEIQSAFLTIKMAEGQDARGITAGATDAIRALDAYVPITSTRTMDEVVGEAMESTSATMIVLGVATAMALFLAAIGLAGVISYVVGQRTREIGVRVALGARAADVSRMILRQSMVVIGVGSVLGLVGAALLSRLMEAILFGVSSTDPVTFATAPAVLITISLLATWLPVRRAARVDPIEALRAE